MTPEEHIERAEWLLALADGNEMSVHAAAVHVRIAEFKKKYPPEVGRPVPPLVRSGYPDNSLRRPYSALPENHPLNQGKPIPDNPQA